METLQADGCLLTVVDVQNDFCHEEGALARLGQSPAMAQEVLPHIEELIELARHRQVPRVFVRVAHSEWTDDPAWAARGAGAAILDTTRVPVAREGEWGSEFYQIEPRPDELVITKHRYSAFPHTPLELVLRARRRSVLVLAGVQTNVCVHATARDAVQGGFIPVVVEDCVAAATELEHRTALEDIRARFGSVVSLEEVRSAWAASQRISSAVQSP